MTDDQDIEALYALVRVLYSTVRQGLDDKFLSIESELWILHFESLPQRSLCLLSLSPSFWPRLSYLNFPKVRTAAGVEATLVQMLLPIPYLPYTAYNLFEPLLIILRITTAQYVSSQLFVDLATARFSILRMPTSGESQRPASGPRSQANGFCLVSRTTN
jgi:hypothetical protein